MQTERSLEQMNAAQQKTIIDLTTQVKELKLWEQFAAHLVNNCVGLTVTPENLEQWMADCQKRKTK